MEIKPGGNTMIVSEILLGLQYKVKTGRKESRWARLEPRRHISKILLNSA